MKSQTSIVAQNTRLNEWAIQIKECQNRPQGMKVEEWCQLNGITKTNYYWRLRKVREALLLNTPHQAAFIELPKLPLGSSAEQPQQKIVAILKFDHLFSMEITDQATAPFINMLIGALKDVK